MGLIGRIKAKLGIKTPKTFAKSVHPDKANAATPESIAQAERAKIAGADKLSGPARIEAIRKAEMLKNDLTMRQSDITGGIEADLVKNDPDSITSAGEALAWESDAGAMETLTKNTESGAIAKMKGFAVNHFIAIAIALGALGVGVFFLVQAQKRKECITALFDRYPQFQNEETLRGLLKDVGASCMGNGATTAVYRGYTLTCAEINDAFARLSECDNTLMKNIISEMVNAARPLVDFALDTAGKAIDTAGSLLDKLKLPFIIVGIVIVVAIVAFGLYSLMQRRKARAGVTAFGTRRPCTPRQRLSYGTRRRMLECGFR